MLRKAVGRNSILFNSNVHGYRSFCERRRRRGDGTKKDIFEERAGASQAEYFRNETARQLEAIKEKLRKQNEEMKEKIEQIGINNENPEDKPCKKP